VRVRLQRAFRARFKILLRMSYPRVIQSTPQITPLPLAEALSAAKGEESRFRSSPLPKWERSTLVLERRVRDNISRDFRMPGAARASRFRSAFPVLVSFRAAAAKNPGPSSPLPVRERIEEPALSLPKGEGPDPARDSFRARLRILSHAGVIRGFFARLSSRGS